MHYYLIVICHPIWNRLCCPFAPSCNIQMGFLDLEVTSIPAKRDTSDRGRFYKITHKHISHLSLPFFFLQEPCPPPLSDTMTPEEVRWRWRDDAFAWFYRDVSLIIYSMVIKYWHTCIESPNLESWEWVLCSQVHVELLPVYENTIKQDNQKPEPGSAAGFCLLKGNFSLPLLPHAWSWRECCVSVIDIITSAV